MSLDLNLVFVYTTVQSIEQGELLASKLLQSRLAVCVNIFKPHTAYFSSSDGSITKTDEVALLIKIVEDQYEQAYDALKQWHPYQIPAILSWPVEVNQAYALWAHHQRFILHTQE